MAEPAPKLDNPSLEPSARPAQTSNTVDVNTDRRDRERAQRLQEQKQQTRALSTNQLPSVPTAGPSQTEYGDGSGKTDANEGNNDQRTQAAGRLARRYGSGEGGEQNEEGDQKKSKKRGTLGKLRQAQSDLRDLRQLLRGEKIGLFGMMMFTVIGSIAGFLDILPIVTGDLASILDWVLDAGFYFMLFITMVVVTGDLIHSIFGLRGVINLAQTILEFIPVSDIIPWHTVAVLVLYLDVKYGIVKIVKNLRKGKGGHPSLGSSVTSG